MTTAMPATIVKTGNPDLFPKIAIPDSTRRSWLRRGVADIVTLDVRDAEFIELHADVAKLEKQVAVLAAVIRLLVTLVRVTGVNLLSERVPTAKGKRRILRAIGRAESAIGRSAALRILGLTPARTRDWTRRELRTCGLEDAPQCPRSVPGRLTRDVRSVIRDMVESDDYKHLSLRSLALLGKRAPLDRGAVRADEGERGLEVSCIASWEGRAEPYQLRVPRAGIWAV